MDPVARHEHVADRAFDGRDLDCGGGLLLLIREHMDPLPRGGLLEIRSSETSVSEDLPAWCRLTGNELVSWTRDGARHSFLVCKGALAERAAAPLTAPPAASPAAPPAAAATRGLAVVAVRHPSVLPAPAPAPAIAPLSVMGIGSWPRPGWLLRAIHEHAERRMSDADFDAAADDAVRLVVASQERAGVDVVTDGEQRRDSYANFVGGRLDNCRLIPLTDVLPLVEHPEELAADFSSLDVPASQVLHPVVFGPLGRSRPLAAHELAFVRTTTAKPVKVAIPGPYLLSRLLWLECMSDRAYPSREALADDIVRVLREEVHDLLAGGAAIVQLDEPVLTEVVFGGAKQRRSFMCGALSEKGSPAVELALAQDLVNRVVEGLPPERVAVHVCRGNWTPDESAALSGDYEPLLPLLSSLKVGTLFLEACTPRAGDSDLLAYLPETQRIGVGVVNPKHARVETVDEILARARRAIDVLGRDRVLLVPDCGFGTFADNPVATAAISEAKLAAMAAAARRLRLG